MQQKNILLFCFLLSAFAMNAQITVRGTVIEADDEPLIGVTIIEKGEVNGTSTDLDGTYELTVKNADAVLVFSYTGFSTKDVPVNGQTLIDVNLEEDVANLDEVIVVGYGTQKKKEVTAAIAKVDSDDLEDMPVLRIEDALQGRTSGVRVTGGSGQPGDGGLVRIRGTATFGNSDPLYIVDGVIVGGGIDYLNQGDIESIEVLKDAASAGIYGSRAARGVVLVTTKGGNNERNEVNYHTYFGTQAPSRRLAVLNAREYGTLLNESWAAAGDTLLFKDVESLGEGTDWQAAIFNNNAPIQNHDLNFSMGNNKSSYYVSFSYFNQKGIISQEKSNYERFTTRLNSTHKITDNITFGNNIAYTKIKSRGISTNSEFGGVVSRALNIDPITPILETDQDLLDNASWYANENRVTNADSIPYGISNLVTSEVVNPVAALSVGDGFGWSDKIVGNFFTEIKLLSDFKFRSSIGGDLAFWGGEGLDPIHYLNGANFNERNKYSRDKNNGFYYIFENTLTYEKQLGDHKINALIGTVAEKNKGEGISGNKDGIPFNTLEEATLSYFVPREDQEFNGYEYLSTNASILGRLNYNFKSKYLFQALFRRDGSSSFGANNKFGIFPAVAVGWVASDENFLSGNDVINFLKLRASWGINGNDDVGAANSFISTIGGGRNYSFGPNEVLTNGSTPNSLSNPDIRWESVIKTNIGFDAKIFRKIGVTFDIYRNLSEGLLGDIATPWYVGIGGLKGNVGNLENQGVDLELSYLGNVGKLKFDFAANVSYSENVVTFLGPEVEFRPEARFGTGGVEITRTQVGQPIASFYGYTTDGLFQNQAEVDAHAFQEEGTAPGDIRFVDLNNDGVIDEQDRSFIGDPTPTWTFGTNLNIQWKRFDLVMFGQGVGGNEVFKATRRFDLPKANMTADALGRWTGEGTSTEYPRLHKDDPNRNFSRSSDFFLEDGSFFRIKTLQIGYSIPRIASNRIQYRDIRLYVSGNNLLTFTKYSGLDPEVNGGSLGIDRGFYPQPRFFLFGINAKF